MGAKKGVKKIPLVHEPKVRVETSIVIGPDLIRMLSERGVKIGAVGQWIAWEVLGRSAREVQRVTGAHRGTLQNNVSGVRRALLAARSDLCITCHEHPARYCIECLAKARKERPTPP